MSIALPLMMGLALEQLIGMTDVLFLGRYGEAELAAAGVAGIYVMLVMMLGLGYTVGSQSLMSRANGAGRAEEVGAIFRQSAIFMTACGFVIMLASWFLIGPMFERFIAADAVRKAADDQNIKRHARIADRTQNTGAHVIKERKCHSPEIDG